MSLEMGDRLFAQTAQHFNKDLFLSSPTSVSGICLWVALGSQAPLLFGDNNTLGMDFPFSLLQTKDRDLERCD